MRAYRHARECPGWRWILVASNHSQDRSVDKNLLQRTLRGACLGLEKVSLQWGVPWLKLSDVFVIGAFFSDVSWIEGSQKLLSFHCSLKIKTIPSSLCTFCIFYRRKFCVYFWQKCFYFISLYSLIERKWFINCSIFENLLTANSEKRWVRSVFAAPTTTTTKIVATHIATRLHHSLHVIICHQMGIRLTNVAILRSTLPWLLEHVTSAITNPDLMEYDSCLSYCETGPSLDGISIGSTGNVKSFKNSMHRLVHFYAHIYLRWTHAAGFDSVYLKWRW